MRVSSFAEVDPPSVLTETSALVIALLTCGIPPVGQPGRLCEIIVQEVDGRPVRTRTWFLKNEPAPDGATIKDLVQKWNDPAWLAANPKHELTITRASLLNAVKVAETVRAEVPLHKVTKGAGSVLIPANASPAERAHWLGKLEGTIRPDELFRPDPS